MSDGLELAHMNILVPINGKEDELSQLCPLLGLHIGSLYHEMYNCVHGTWRWPPG